VQHAIDEVLAADSTLKQVVGTYHLIARGAGYDHAFGVALHGLPAGTTGTLQIERFGGSGTDTLEAAVPFGPNLTQDASGSWMLRIDDLFPSTRAALPPSAAEGGYTNTWFSTPTTPPASVRFLLTFDRSIAASSLGLPPFDPYLLVKHTDGNYDIHRPGMAPFGGRPSGLPAESGPNSFLDANGFPFELLLPYEWRYPLESVNIEAGGRGLATPYMTFTPWRTSHGANASTWYTSPTASAPACVTDALSDESRARPWSLILQ
jgi:LruC domain-containing protein